MPPQNNKPQKLTPEQQRALDRAMGECLRLKDGDALNHCLSAGANASAIIRVWENGNHIEMPAFIYAAHEGSLASTGKTFIAHGADVNVRDANGATALMKAVARRHSEDIKFLLANGADVNVQDNDGNSALLHALRATLATTQIQLLLDAGADVLAQNKKGEVALDRAMASMGNSIRSDREATVFKNMVASLPKLKKDFAEKAAAGKSADVRVNAATEIKAPHLRVGAAGRDGTLPRKP